MSDAQRAMHHGVVRAVGAHRDGHAREPGPRIRPRRGGGAGVRCGTRHRRLLRRLPHPESPPPPPRGGRPVDGHHPRLHRVPASRGPRGVHTRRAGHLRCRHRGALRGVGARDAVRAVDRADHGAGVDRGPAAGGARGRLDPLHVSVPAPRGAGRAGHGRPQCPAPLLHRGAGAGRAQRGHDRLRARAVRAHVAAHILAGRGCPRGRAGSAPRAAARALASRRSPAPVLRVVASRRA